MSSFKPNKRHLRELLIYFFNLKKSAAEAHRLFVETYGEAALSERSCCEWFQKFKNGELTSKTKNVAEGQKCTKTRNWKHYWIKIHAKPKKNNTILWIKHKVSFFHNKCPIFDRNGGNLFVHLIAWKLI